LLYKSLEKLPIEGWFNILKARLERFWKC